MREKLPTVFKSVFDLFCCIAFNVILQSESQICLVLSSGNFGTTNSVVFTEQVVSTSLYALPIFDRLNRS